MTNYTSSFFSKGKQRETINDGVDFKNFLKNKVQRSQDIKRLNLKKMNY